MKGQNWPISCTENIVKISRYFLNIAISRYFQMMQYIAFAIYRDTKRSPLVVVYFWCITSFLYYLIVQNYALYVMLRTSMSKLDLSKLCKFCILIWIMHISQRFPKVFHKISPRFPQDFPQDSTRFLQDSLNHPHSSYLTAITYSFKKYSTCWVFQTHCLCLFLCSCLFQM